MVRRIITSFAFFLAFAFIVVGYASLSDVMMINGMASFVPKPKGVYITKVEVVASNGVSDVNTDYISPTNVISVVNSLGGGSITYRITVENTSNSTNWYRGTVVVDDLAGVNNGLVGTGGGINVITKDKIDGQNGSFNTDDWLPPLSTREFYAVYNFGSNVKGEISTLINFSFGVRVASYGDGFLAILNDPEKYAILSSSFDSMYSKNGSTIISNVGVDKAFITSLFGTEIMLDGKPVTIAIERLNVDQNDSTGDRYSPTGPYGCEYTIYVKTDDGRVHAVSYVLDGETGLWRQIGEFYEGTAGTATYTDSEGGRNSTTINVDSWIAAPKEYEMFEYDGFSVKYLVGQTQTGDQFDRYQKIDQLMGCSDQDIYNALNGGKIRELLYRTKQIIDRYPNSELTEIHLLQQAYDEMMNYYHTTQNVGEYIMNPPNEWTRAEIIAALESFQQALEYYDQVHV